MKMIEVDERKLLELVEDAMWYSDTDGYYHDNTKIYFNAMLKENMLNLSKEDATKLADAVKERELELDEEFSTLRR